MKKILSTILFLIALPVYAGMNIGTTAIDGVASGNTAATNATHCFLIYPTSVSGATDRFILQNYTLLSNYYEIVNSTLTIFNVKPLLGTHTSGTWTVPISANTWQFVCVAYQWGTDGATMRVVINGVSQTVTVVTAPAGATNWFSGTYAVGSDGSDTNDFLGVIDELYTYTTQLTVDEMKQVTTSGIKGFGKQIQSASLDGYWAMDEVNNATTCSGGSPCTIYDYKGLNNWTADSGTGWAEYVLSYY